MASASSIVIMHNHPSGESQPSEADIKITRDLIRGGQLLKIDVVDHVVILSKGLDKIIYAECWIIPSW
jgi:DNA repair protein RadC